MSHRLLILAAATCAMLAPPTDQGVDTLVGGQGDDPLNSQASDVIEPEEPVPADPVTESAVEAANRSNVAADRADAAAVDAESAAADAKSALNSLGENVAEAKDAATRASGSADAVTQAASDAAAARDAAGQIVEQAGVAQAAATAKATDAANSAVYAEEAAKSAQAAAEAAGEAAAAAEAAVQAAAGHATPALDNPNVEALLSVLDRLDRKAKASGAGGIVELLNTIAHSQFGVDIRPGAEDL